jgi:heptosyltransferase-2
VPRILVIAPSWIGDAVLAQPLFKRLRERHPILKLDVFATPWTRPLFARMPEVSATIENPFRHGELALKRRYETGIGLAERYDQAIVLPNSFKSALIPFFAGIPLRTGFVGEARRGLLNDARKLDELALPRIVERYAMLGEPPGDPVKRPVANPVLKIDAERRSATLTKLGLTLERPVAVLCPGAEYGPAKRWPPPYFAELARRLSVARHAVWILGSAQDAPIGAEIARTAPGACVDLCGRTSLDEAIDLMSCAALVISNDSGLMHIAAGLDRPLTAIYGSSSSAFTPPLSPHANVVRLGLPCSPCFQRVCPLGHFNCMLQLDPDQLWRTMQAHGTVAPPAPGARQEAALPA